MEKVNPALTQRLEEPPIMTNIKRWNPDEDNVIEKAEPIKHWNIDEEVDIMKSNSNPPDKNWSEDGHTTSAPKENIFGAYDTSTNGIPDKQIKKQKYEGEEKKKLMTAKKTQEAPKTKMIKANNDTILKATNNIDKFLNKSSSNGIPEPKIKNPPVKTITDAKTGKPAMGESQGVFHTGTTAKSIAKSLDNIIGEIKKSSTIQKQSPYSECTGDVKTGARPSPTAHPKNLNINIQGSKYTTLPLGQKTALDSMV